MRRARRRGAGRCDATMRRARVARGFTLIEVLIAMTIAAVALMAAIRATGSLAVNGADLRNRTLAQWSAENRLAQIRISSEWPNPGRRQYDCSQASVVLLCREDVIQTPNPLFRRVEVSVFDEHGSFRLARLVGFSTRLP
ncbi:MAG: type II secretion system minor pseudopilin GspI [Burkholderiaceae bacterium]|nr:type II secretion system minor pseudopilin GspI [Burkholderiaceae bacterium]